MQPGLRREGEGGGGKHSREESEQPWEYLVPSGCQLAGVSSSLPAPAPRVVQPPPSYLLAGCRQRFFAESPASTLAACSSPEPSLHGVARVVLFKINLDQVMHP